jgi:hypothetical protein
MEVAEELEGLEVLAVRVVAVQRIHILNLPTQHIRVLPGEMAETAVTAVMVVVEVAVVAGSHMESMPMVREQQI